ncbi:hypothetical protein L798_14668 [Zootermopsis nevadensis]|uniref:Uncharacterized protein n=1 Tax=Zootermopsis nevadensis TaxID=136037 RepID=A0A067QP18_ZOONE|nr:hypothetical protein L798_14668 [Zootermopsis nevadensis]
MEGNCETVCESTSREKVHQKRKCVNRTKCKYMAKKAQKLIQPPS